tara:strand:+ start:2724 stop:3062 length:339 start_codon:yes stop_codon:yes gene_type:complete
MTKAKRLTKAQREFFDGVTKDIVRLMLALGLDADDFKEVEDLIDEVDLSELTELVGQQYLERISFTELKRVERFTKSDAYQKVQTVGAEVGEAIKDTLVESVREVILARATK